MFSNRYVVFEDGATVAGIQQAAFRERAALRIGDRTLKLTRQGLLRGSLVLTEHGVEIARAERAGTMSRVWHIRSTAGDYELVRPSWWRRAHELRSGGLTVGSIQPQGPFRRRVVADLPPQMAIELRVFILVAVLTLWRREDSAGATGS